MTELTVRSIHTGEQYVPAICERASEADRVTCLYGNSVEGLATVVVTLRDHDQAPVPQFMGIDYPIERMQRALSDVIRRCGLGLVPYTVAARFLTEVPSEPANPKADEAIVAPTLRVDESSNRTSVVRVVCAELKIEPQVARKQLRAAGMHAPYTDEKKIREILRGTK